MIVAIASGKGGTGKTTVAVNLASVIKDGVQLADCDVEEPNAHLFLAAATIDKRPVTLPVPEVDATRCDGCGACARFCAYHAIVSFGVEALVFADLCHGCGGCALVCPREAIRERARRIGEVETSRAGSLTLIQGRLDVGVAMAPPLIRAVKARLDPSRPAILDAPPGTACPMVTTLRGVDRVILVTEPTPFGLHDLSLAVATVRSLGLEAGVVINRAGCGDDRVHTYCAAERLPLLAEIPDDRRVAEVYARGGLVVEALPEYRSLFTDLAERLLARRVPAG